jgi:hypothetical protein
MNQIRDRKAGRHHAAFVLRLFVEPMSQIRRLGKSIDRNSTPDC